MPRRRGKVNTQERYYARCEQMSDGAFCIKLTGAFVRPLFWKNDDCIEWSKSHEGNTWTAANLSIRILYMTRFRRNLNSLSKVLNSPYNPLRRVVIKSRCGSKSSTVMIAESANTFDNIGEKSIKNSASSMPKKIDLRKLANCFEQAVITMGTSELAVEWLNKPALALNGEHPIDLLQTTEGAELVRQILERIDWGVYT